MDLLFLLAIGVVGTVIPIFSPEGTAVAYGHSSSWSPWIIGAVAAAGQCLTFSALYLGGARLIPRFRGLNALLERTRVRFADHLERRYLVAVAFGSFLGIPPAIGLAALAPGFGVPLAHVLPILYVGRTVRLALLASTGPFLDDVWRWLKALVA